MTDKQFAFLQRFLFLFYRHIGGLRYVSYILVSIMIILFWLSDLPFLLWNGKKIKYDVYQNIEVSIQDHRVYGKLNEHINIQQRNNRCYKENCGLFVEGHYKLSELQFVNIHGDNFIKRLCVENSACYDNLFDEQIEQYWQALHEQAIQHFINNLLIMLPATLFSLPFLIFYLEAYMRMRIRRGYMESENEEINEMMIEL
ncbi:hypothetical protein K7G92_001862 [Pasteurella canis]|uniref:hypothetical protein n=1 Tax=Pasteurella canis TaxID=753 RepID=UPI001E5A8A19|nr:hypothetical protein [Pasteurella canis]UEA16585.1 hypothetical protein K7G92_001862 [Pasteurella canis]